MANDLGPCAGFFAIQIAASNVRLRLDGHTITGVIAASGAGADGISATGVQRVRIEGPGTITGCRFAINWQNVLQSEVKKVTASTNVSAFFIQGGADNRFKENTANDNFAAGFFLDGANNSRLADNIVTNNAREGITVLGSGNHLTGNTANHNGFDVDCAGGFDGMKVSGSRNVIVQNTANGNCTDGIGIFSGTGNILARNTTLGNRLGIGIFTSSTESLIVENIALGNTLFDLLDFNPNCDANHWVENTFVSTNQGCIH